MNKTANKVIELIGNGYGLSQMMDAAKLDKKSLIELASQEAELRVKLQKRFKGTEWIDNITRKEPEELPTSNDTPEMAALKAEAKELGVEFNAMIGYDKLKARVDEFKQKAALKEPEE